MATFSTRLVCQTSGDPPPVGPLYITYPTPETVFEGVRVPFAAAHGVFFGVVTAPAEHVFGPLYRVLVVVEGQFLLDCWPNAPPSVRSAGLGKYGFLSRRQ